MPIQLPPAFQTAKLNSLSGKAREAVEELIAQKFGLGEVVEPDDYGQRTWSNSFTSDWSYDVPVDVSHDRLTFHMYSYATNARAQYVVPVARGHIATQALHQQIRRLIEEMARTHFMIADTLLNNGVDIEVDNYRCQVRNDNGLYRLAADLCRRLGNPPSHNRFM